MSKWFFKLLIVTLLFAHLAPASTTLGKDFSPREVTEEATLQAAARTERVFELASIDGVPEVKTVMEKQCKHVLGKPICIKVPVIYRRTSKLTAYVRISSGLIKNDQVWSAVRGCVSEAAVSAGIAGILASYATSGAGGLAAAKATFTATLVGCLRSKGKEFARIATDLRLDLFTKQEHGDWKRSS